MTRSVDTRFLVVGAVTLASACSVATRTGSSLPGRAGTPAIAQSLGAKLQPLDRMLVRRGDLEEVVDDLTPPVRRTHSLTESVGGYIASESRDDGHATVSMRVPEPKLDAALDSLSELGTVTSRKVSSQDVTEETIDVEARIQSLNVERDQLRELLSKTTTINDVFTIERELARVQGEIDSMQHRLEHLRGTAAMAELNAQFSKRRERGPVGAFFAAIGRGIGRLF